MSSWRNGGSVDGQKTSWKKNTKATRAPTTGKYWASGNGNTPLISGNLVRLFIAVAALLAATVGMVVYLLNTNLSTPVVSIASIEYEYPWAPNAWALEDQQRLQSLGESNQFQVTARQERGKETWQHLIQSELEKVIPGGPGGSLIPALWGYRTIILHLSAHGVLNSSAQPCLLFTSADCLDESTWVPLSEVLSAIGEHPTVLEHQARVLVVLDSGKQPPDPRCGVISTGFTDAARETIQALAYDHFAVLLSHAEDQCAWVAPEMGGSVFGVMVASGLQGTADTIAGNKDSLVTVQELARFVSSSVDGYVRENRGRAQKPNLIWCGEDQTKDFQLCYRARYTTSPAAIYQVNPRIERMAQAWQMLEDWNRQTPSYLAWPRSQAAGRLARAEQLLWAGAGYVAQFEAELNVARQIIGEPVRSPWPRLICGGSLAFLNRVHGIDSARELKSAGLEPFSIEPAGPATEGGTRPASARGDGQPPPSNVTSDGKLASTVAATAGSEPAQASSAGATPNSSPSEASASAEAPPSEAKELTPAQQISAWLTFQPGASEAAPPERPQLPARPLAIGFLTRWLADNPQAVNAAVLQRIVDWLGPIGDGRGVTREEALLRTLHEHLQLTSGWKLEIQDRVGQLWSQYLRVAAACEWAMALVDPRGTRAMEKVSVNVARELQLVRDRILGCETERDTSDCANDLLALQASAADLLQLRERLESGWRLRDEAVMELPTLAQWLASPINRLQTLTSVPKCWELSGQLSQRLQQLQAQLSDGDIPEQNELDATARELEQLATAYREALHEVFESSAKGQRRQLSNLTLCLGLRPNLYRGYPLSDRGKLHQGLNERYSDLQNVYSPERLKGYYVAGSTDQSAAAIWQLEDLPQAPAATYSPLVFTERITGRALASVLSSAASPRQRWAALGGELRERWRQLPEQIADRCQASLTAMDSSDEAALRSAEAALLESDYQAHMLASLIPSQRLNVLPDPARATQEISNAQFALWQARRGLADFWKTPLLPQSTGSWFMLASADDWQAAAPCPVPGPTQLIKQQRLAAEQLARQWEQIWQHSKAAQPPDNVWQAELSLANFPAGRAWISLALQGNMAQPRPFENKRMRLEQGTGARGSASARISVPTENLPEGNHQLQAWFRGHSAVAPIHIESQQPPIRLAWQAEMPGPTTIRVDAEPRPARIIFVLDCSNSLLESRMTLAKDTLVDLIREMEKDNSASEIAVILFGHRVDYRDTEADQFSKWTAQVPAEVRPYNDVEIVQPLAPLTQQLVQNLEAKLQPLKKFGRTPLYESIRQAANLLLQSRGGFTGELRIVVITDGDDNVLPFRADAYNATARGRLKVPDNFVHSEDDVVRFLQDDIRLDLVTFNFRKDEGEDRLAGLIGKLNSRSKRAGLLAADDKDLADKLRKSISGTYSTKNLATNATLGARVRISDEQFIPADQLVQQPSAFEVQIDDTAERQTVELRGGETIELQYRRGGGLSFLPYDDGDQHPMPGKILFAEQPHQAIMLTGIPRSVPQIRFCLQSQDPFVQSKRPSQFVLELQRTRPGQSSQQGERLAWTSDGLWENGHRSPVLRVMIKDLPELQRDRLECRLWLPGAERGEPAESIPVSRLLEQAVPIAPGISVSASTQRVAEGLRVILTETRQADTPLVHWQVFPVPDKAVQHQIYRSEVVHEYIYSDPTVLSQIEVTATPLPPAPDASWQTTPWMPVPEWR